MIIDFQYIYIYIYNIMTSPPHHQWLVLGAGLIFEARIATAALWRGRGLAWDDIHEIVPFVCTVSPSCFCFVLDINKDWGILRKNSKFSIC